MRGVSIPTTLPQLDSLEWRDHTRRLRGRARCRSARSGCLLARVAAVAQQAGHLRLVGGRTIVCQPAGFVRSTPRRTPSAAAGASPSRIVARTIGLLARPHQFGRLVLAVAQLEWIILQRIGQAELAP